jgi:purine-binding chemotaxis protein CheW
MTSPSPGVRDENRVELACLELRGRSYAVDVRQVREIVRDAALTKLPRAPVLIEGLLDLRGGVLPVVDLGRALGEPPIAPAPGNRIVVLEAEGLRFGLRVESAVEVLSVDASGVDDPPRLATHAGYVAVSAVVRREAHAPLLVLSLEHLLEIVVRSEPEGEVAA